MTTIRRVALALLFISASLSLASGSAANIYIANAVAGSANGSSCSNALASSFFNNSSNWGSGATQIGPGTTVHLCGIFNAPAGASGYLTFQTGGAPGSPITLVAEPGAVLQAPYWGEQGAIAVNQDSNIVIDGGGTGLIQATANGTSRANQAPNCGGWCSSGIFLLQCDNCTVRNWTIGNIYVNVPPADESNAGQGSSGIFFNSGNNAVISGNTIHDAKWCLFYGFAGGATTQNVSISGNTEYNCDHGIFVGSDDGGAFLNNVYVYGNTLHDAANWDDNANGNHHDGIHVSPSQSGTGINNANVYNNYIYGDWGGNCNSFVFMEADAADQAITASSAFNNLLVNTSSVHTCANGLLQDYGGQNMLIANNTLVGSTQSAGIGLILEESGAYRPRVENNVYANLQNAFYVAQGDTFPVSDYNDFYSVGNVAFIWGTECCTALTDWQGQVGSPDLHSSTANPGLSSSYVPQTGGAALLRGANLTSLGLSALDFDRVGTARSASGAWDVGAYASGTVAAAQITLSVSPTSMTLAQSGQQQFTATVTGSTAGVTWSMSPSVGTLSAAGLYTAPGSISTAQTVSITASAVGSPAVTASAVVNLTPPAPTPIVVVVSPTAMALGQSGQQQFTATVTGSTAGVTWSMTPSVGTLSAAGMYTAPSSIATAQTVSITAKAVGNPAVTASAVVTLTVPAPVQITLGVSPTLITLGQSGQQRFTATATGSTAGVTWSMSPAVGTLSSAGVYTAPSSIATAQTVSITAKAVGNPAVTASAVVSLTPPAPPPTVPVSLAISPVTVSLGPSAQQVFVAALNSSGATAVGGIAPKQPSIAWTMNPPIGSLSSSGLYTAPVSITATQNILVTATAGTTSVSAVVTLTPPLPAPVTLSISVTPELKVVRAGNQLQFVATVKSSHGGKSTAPVSWSLSPKLGTISATGLYTAPAAVSGQPRVTVTATVTGSPSVSASGTVVLK